MDCPFEKDSSLEKLIKTHWTFCGLWRRSFPAAGPWLESLYIQHGKPPAGGSSAASWSLHALSDRGFEGPTEANKAMSGKDVTVSLTAGEENDSEEH